MSGESKQSPGRAKSRAPVSLSVDMRDILMPIAGVSAQMFVSFGANANTLKSKSEMRALTDKVVATIASGDFEGGLKEMNPFIIIPQSEFDASLESAKFQWPAVLARFGNPIGHEFICEKGAGQSVFRIIQIVKFEKHVARFTFLFYKPQDEWVLNTYNFDDKIQSLFCD